MEGLHVELLGTLHLDTEVTQPVPLIH
jgi:hypothetical protein